MKYLQVKWTLSGAHLIDQPHDRHALAHQFILTYGFPRMIRFKIFGIPVNVQPFFWITMAILGTSFLPSSTPEKDTILLIGLFVLAGFVSIMIHELGHALMVRYFGLPTAITLHTFGGFATYPAGILSRPKSFLVTAGGPGLQILFAFLASLVLNNPLITENQNLTFFISVLYKISLFWALLNLLPVLPLDGGQLLHALLGPARIRLTLYISIGFALLGAILLSQVGFMIFPIYLIFMAWESWKTLQINSPR
ncbi:hypothetical protein JIN85_12535 [Luteolibacter pohnpeiensis]|uniref:Peptidase M50 domain-containing protein n=1 Tax=Luteolibacter pohnpeiensis TaxID=454153 RepID=A0A934S8F2_9BACT|nr:site-2 protease family protein [Luteolibacter pohnpeiensis]MBK1883245.1 hypothetical protein [Luteolibacter pohnpeiensis]